jgi:hypothetical protein
VCCGFDWPGKMLLALKHVYRPQERMVSGPTHMSLTEVLDHAIIKRLQAAGGHDELIAAVSIFGYALIALIALYLVWTWRRARVDSPRFSLYYALAVAATLLISLHAQYYDSAILLLPVLLILADYGRRQEQVSARTRLILVLLFFLSLPLFYLSQATWMPFQPFVLLPIGIALWARQRILSC